METPIMQKTIFLLTLLVITMNILADSSVMADIKEYYRMQREEPSEPTFLKDHWAHLDKIKARFEPVVRQEFSKIVDSDVSSLIRDLLKDSEAIDFCAIALCGLLRTYSIDKQTNVLQKVFNATPDSQWATINLTLLWSLPKEAFFVKEIQQWLVNRINGGMPAGAYYFILTEESADAVAKAAVASMYRFSKTVENSNESRDNRLFSLMSTIFLASRGDDNAIKLLDSLLDQRDINNSFDRSYVIPAATMTGNERLIRKVGNIITTDKRTIFSGEPTDYSFAHEAAFACSLTIEGFPPVRPRTYTEETKKKVHDWLKNNRTRTAKLEDPRVFLRETNLDSVFSAMRRTHERSGQ